MHHFIIDFIDWFLCMVEICFIYFGKFYSFSTYYLRVDGESDSWLVLSQLSCCRDKFFTLRVLTLE